MEQHALKSVNNCLNTNIYSYLETYGSQSSILYLNVVHFFNTIVNRTAHIIYQSRKTTVLSYDRCHINSCVVKMNYI